MINLSSQIQVLAGVVFAYAISSIVYKLVFHPLHNIPGDKLAALTEWYRHYYSIMKGGGMLEQIENLHIKYGPVVRVGPNELHFSDPQAYALIYTVGSKFTKEPKFYKAFGGEGGSFSFTDPKLAKTRKDILSPLFSRKAIHRLEDVVQEKVDLLVTQILSYEDQPIDMSLAFRSTTLDIIISYCFATSYEILAYPSFRHPILIGMQTCLPIYHCLRAFPFLHWIMPRLPDRLTTMLNPAMKGFIQLSAKVEAQIAELLADPKSLDRADHENIYHHLLNPQASKGPKQIPSKKSLLDEGLSLLFAGSDTVGNACTVGTFHILRNKNVYAKLVKELEEAWPEKDRKMGHEALEKLPYLTAVIKESLRMSYGVVCPLPRVVGPSSAEIAGVHIPVGTIISIGSTFLHNNPNIFVDPMTFIPERWLQPNSPELENYLVPFSKGPRSCLGINLAWCELYLLFGNVFRKLHMAVHDTTADDFKFREHFLPLYTGKHFHVKLI